MTTLEFKLNLIKIPVSDVATAVTFYRDVLGLPEEFSAPQYGWAQFRLGDVPFCLYQTGMGGGQGTPGACDSVHLTVDDIDAAYEILRARGAAVPEGIQRGNDGTAFFDLADPDGNIIKIIVPPQN